MTSGPRRQEVLTQVGPSATNLPSMEPDTTSPVHGWSEYREERGWACPVPVVERPARPAAKRSQRCLDDKSMLNRELPMISQIMWNPVGWGHLIRTDCNFAPWLVVVDTASCANVQPIPARKEHPREANCGLWGPHMSAPQPLPYNPVTNPPSDHDAGSEDGAGQPAACTQAGCGWALADVW